MTILIDEARWHHRGRKWCHLVSDVSYDELHDFAGAHGIPRRGFQGDHYDIPEEYRADLIDAGAVVVESRELLRRLKGAGLRLTATQRRRFGQSVTNSSVSSASVNSASATNSSVNSGSVTSAVQRRRAREDG